MPSSTARRGAGERYQPLVKPTDKGREFARAVTSGLYKYLAIGGAVGGVKSFTTISALIVLCRIFPGSRWAIVRKDLPTLKRNTIPTIEKMRPAAFMAPLNRSDWTYRCTNGSELILFPESLQEDPDLNRWKGLEVNGFLLEEANELAEKSFHKSIERAGRWVIPETEVRPEPAQPPVLIFLTFNPADNWVKSTFYEPYHAGTLAPPYYYLPTSMKDNPFLPQDYIDSLESLPENEYKRFVLGDWTATTDPNQLIHSEWIIKAGEVEEIPGPARLGVDVARFGDDQTILLALDGNTLAEIDPYEHIPINKTAEYVALKIAQRPISAANVRVDVVGMGGGVVDNLTAIGMHVHPLESGGTPVLRMPKDPNYSILKYKNLRSQMWWELREKLRTERFRLPRPIPKRLFEDLIAPRYKIAADKVIEVESKDDIKKRLGRSTDMGDALVYAAFDLPDAPTRRTGLGSRSFIGG